MEFKEILKFLEKEGISENDFAYNEFGTAFMNEKGDYEEDCRVLPGLGKIKEVAQKGGEGEGDEWYSVKHFIDLNLYIRINGWYSSYNGTDFNSYSDCCELVTPVERMVTIYKTI